MKRLFIALLSVGLLTVACSDTSEVSQVELDPTDIQLVNRLIPFDDCENVLDHIKEEAWSGLVHMVWITPDFLFGLAFKKEWCVPK